MFSCQKHFSKNKLVQNDKKINNITDTIDVDYNPYVCSGDNCKVK